MHGGVAADTAAIGRTAGLDDSLARAHKLAVEQGHGTVALEHVLFALTDEPEAATMLAASRVGLEQLRTDVSGYIGRLSEGGQAVAGVAPRPGADLLRILQLAGMAARQSQRHAIDGGIVLAAIIGDGNSTAAGLLKAHGLTFEEVIRVLQSSAAPRVAADPRRGELTAPAGPPVPAAAEAPPPAPSTDGDILAAARARVKRAEPPPLRPIVEPIAATSVSKPPVVDHLSPPSPRPPVPQPVASNAPPPLPAPHPAAVVVRPPTVQPPALPRAQPVGSTDAIAQPGPVLAHLRPAAPPPLSPPPPPATSLHHVPPVMARPGAAPPHAPYPAPPAQPARAQPPAPPAPPPIPALLPLEPLDIVRAAARLPAMVRRNSPVLIEIVIPRQQVDVPRSLPLGGPAQPPVFRAVTTRLASGPVSGLSIEPRTAETAWLGPADGDKQARDVVWQFVLTPIRAGVFAVTLTVTGRTISLAGMASDVTATAETFAVRVKPERGRLSRRLLGGLLLLAVGGGIGWLLGGPLAGVVKALLAQLN